MSLNRQVKVWEDIMRKIIIGLLIFSLLFSIVGCKKTQEADESSTEVSSESTEQEQTSKSEDSLQELSRIPAEEIPLPSEEETLYGEWYAKQYGMILTLQLSEDGIYQMRLAEEAPFDGTWQLKEGFIIFDGDEAQFLNVLSDSLLWEEASLLFTREMPETYVPAPVRSDVDLSFFSGYWKSAYVDMGGYTAEAEAMDDNTDIFIEDNHVALGGDFFDDAITDFVFADGALTFTDENLSITLQIQEDSLLRLSIDSGTESVILYLEYKGN